MAHAGEFGPVLRAARAARGLTQEELANASGLHRTEISLLERGKRTPLLETLVAISRALGMTPAELLHDITVPQGREHRQQPRVPWF